MKHQTPTLPKFKKLKRRLGLSKDRDAMGLLESLWLLAQKSAHRGDVGRQLDNEDIAIELEWDGDADSLISALVETRWLDRCVENRLVIHNWADHAPRYIHGIVAKKGGFAVVTTVKDHSPGLQSTTKPPLVGDCSREQPNLTQPNLTQPNPISLSSKDDDNEQADLFEDVDQGDPSDSKPDAVDEVIEIWNETSGVKPVKRISASRRDKIRTRLKDPTWPWRECIAKLPLPGEVGAWQPDFDWFIANDTNASKVVEGNYEWRGGVNKVGTGQTFDRNSEFGIDF